jgi:uncharacterized membrane protein (UPF0182 family)
MLFSLFGGVEERGIIPLKPLRWLLALFFVLLFVPRLLAFYTESLWFDSLGYSPVFWFEWRAKIMLFVGFFAVTFLLLRGAFRLFERAFEPFTLGGSIRRFDGQPLNLDPELFMRPAAWVVSIVWSLIVAATMTARWPLWALFLNQASSTERDPIFNNPLNFYFFSWPVLEMLAAWLSGVSVFIFLAAAMWALLAYISRMPRAAQEVARRKAYLVTALALAGVLLTWTARLYLARFSLLWKGDDIYNGIGYVAARITLPSYVLLMGVLTLCALLAIFNALRMRNLKVFLVCLLTPTLISFIAGLVENYVSNFVVKPNQLALETPYLKYNIAATRKAFSLDRIAAREFPADGSVQAIQTAANQSSEKATRTLENVRLWDWRALQATLTQTQTLRGYYEFPDVDVDRYVINGKLRQVMIAARELDTSRLPANSRNWVNQRLIYTHGYGVVMNTASEFTPEGRPRFIVSEMPLRSRAPEINITRPEIYFGQETNDHVYVKTTQQEFNFVQGGKDSYSNYEGEGGILLGSGLRRFALAWSLGDITKIPFSKAITKDTRVLLHRQIIDRVSRLAPFLQLDNDPYVIAGKDGKLYWMLDAYTTSLYHPYATHYQVGGEWANYARNSVKIVIDAYNGTTDFYVFEPNDPIIQSWRKIFPALFKDADTMPPDLRAHVRYPETLFRTQNEVYGVYHTDDVSAFFSRNDLWSVARLQDNDSGSTPATVFPQPGMPGPVMPGQAPMPRQPMTPYYPPSTIGNRNGDGFIEPYFLLTQLPGSDAGEEFLLSVPFTPNGRPLNLSGWLAARSDGENYGQLALYDIAESRNISAPQQILAHITQDGELSKLISLWNQQKSSVLWGNLLVIPIGRGLLYVQPIFLQSNSSPLPELRLVVLATQDEIFYAPTYEGALKKLLGDTAALPSASTPDTGVTMPSSESAHGGSTPAAPGNARTELIEKAARDLSDYQRLTAAGKYGEAGQKLESLKKNLETLRRTP